MVEDLGNEAAVNDGKAVEAVARDLDGDGPDSVFFVTKFGDFCDQIWYFCDQIQYLVEFVWNLV